MQDRIIEKAKKLGINPSSNNDLEKLEEIALSLGLNNFDPTRDLNALENALNMQLNSIDYEEGTDNNFEQNDSTEQTESIEQAGTNNNISNRSNNNSTSFGETEYKNALDENGKYDKDFYSKKGEELQDKLNKVKEERDRSFKKKDPKDLDPIKADGSNTIQKNWLDKRKDDINYLKAKNDVRKNQMAGKKAEIYKNLHPIKHAKQQLKGSINEGLKNAGKSAAKNVSKAGKNVAKSASKAIKSVASKLKNVVLNNKVVLLVVIIISVIFLLLVCFMFFMAPVANATGSGYYDKTYNYNESTVTYTNSETEESSEMKIDEYIMGVVYANTKDDESFSNEAKKAMMITIKTNLLSTNGYNYNNKNITGNLNYESVPEEQKEEYKKLYTEIENYLYLSKDYSGVIENLSQNDVLEFNIDDFKAKYNMSYKNILNEIFKAENLELYDFTDYAKFYEYSKYNTAFWWPIGSAEVTLGTNIYGGNPTATRISSKYGMRKHPIHGDYRMHNGIDIAASCGEVLIATKAGKVTVAVNGCVNGEMNCGGGFGNYVIIDHGDGIFSVYAHMTNNSTVVKVGEEVAQGQKVGLVGTTGTSTGCHLHFEIRNNGSRVNPLEYINPENTRPIMESANNDTTTNDDSSDATIDKKPNKNPNNDIEQVIK